MNTSEFQEMIWQQGRELFRNMPWRQNTHPYYVLVSELMLQQTQVDRVIPKFEQFIATFPTIDDLASASLESVVQQWSGLGYNRRAKFLHAAANMVVQQHGGEIPDTYDALVTLPGVGPNTAGAILAYGFNKPAAFIETNVRTVYFHHYFDKDVSVSDTQLRQVVEATIDYEHPREWYWAMMDYGSWLKKHSGGRLDKSKHYKKQAPLKGSVREVRGLILKRLLNGGVSPVKLEQAMPQDERYGAAIISLERDGLIVKDGDMIRLA